MTRTAPALCAALAFLTLAAATPASAAETMSDRPIPAPTPGPTGAKGGPALAPEQDKNNVNSAVGGTGELPNSPSISGGEDPSGSPTNCLAGDTRPHCAQKMQP